MKHWLWLLLVAVPALSQPQIPPPAPKLFLLPVPVGTYPGALGTVWSNELWIHNRGARQVTVAPGTCRVGYACLVTIPAGETIHLPPPASNEPAAYTTLSVPYDADIHFTLRTRNLNAAAESAGTEIPVVHPGELLAGNAQFLEVPNDPRFRVRLRLFLHPHGGQQRTFAVRVFDMKNDRELLLERQVMVERFPLPPVYTGSPAGVTAVDDLLSDLPSDVQSVRIEVEPKPFPGHIWAFVSVTHNETQHVAIITPQ